GERLAGRLPADQPVLRDLALGAGAGRLPVGFAQSRPLFWYRGCERRGARAERHAARGASETPFRLGPLGSGGGVRRTTRRGGRGSGPPGAPGSVGRRARGAAFGPLRRPSSRSRETGGFRQESPPPHAGRSGGQGRARSDRAPGRGGALLQLDGGAGALELALELLGLLLRGGLLDGVGRAVDEVLGLLEAEAGDGADLLDDGDLVAAGGGEDDVELGLLLGGGGGAVAPGRAGHDGGGGGGLDAVGVLEDAEELVGLLDREVDEALGEGVDVCHGRGSRGAVPAAVSAPPGPGVAVRRCAAY